MLVLSFPESSRILDACESASGRCCFVANALGAACWQAALQRGFFVETSG